MKALILLVVVVCVGCGTIQKENSTPPVVSTSTKWVSDPSDPNNVKIERAIRSPFSLNKPTGELTKSDLEKVTKLNLSNNYLTELPKGLEKLTKLTKLYLQFNKLTDTEGLEKLTQLTDLLLDSNQLTEIPKGLEKLTKLKRLHLSSNQLTSVKGLEKLTKLTELGLADNRLTDVKGLEKLTQLTYLYLSSKQLTELPKGLANAISNPALTKAQIDQLQKALPNCKILSNTTK